MRTQIRLTDRMKPEWFAAGHPIENRPLSSNVLIADDHAGSRLGYRVTLEAAGYEVAEAEDGAQALEFLGQQTADLLLLDLSMPGLDGMEVLRELREMSVDVPVVVITAHGSIPRALRAMELGALDFLAKPVEPAVLRETVLNAIVRRALANDASYRPAPNSLASTARRFSETLDVARRALEHGHFDLTEYLLNQALDLDADSAEANALRGALHESLGEHHAAYQAYRRALTHDPHQVGAVEGMRRYCQRFGLDPGNKAINPARD